MSQYKKLVEKHFHETESLLRKVPKDEVAEWILKKGFFPESNILPPTFSSIQIELKGKPYNKLVKLTKRLLASISYPKSLLSSRKFSIQHPFNYHDIVFYLHQDWDKVLDKLFDKKIRVYSYSLPIPLAKDKSPHLSKLRSGRMIYEWVQMAENDLIHDAIYYKFLVKTDITNFYASIYTHSIAWALEGMENASKDKDCALLGSKIDKLTQYANNARTNGIPIGSALSDLIAEIILSDIDARVSEKLKNLDFIAVRFKDDYRILCQNENDGKKFLTTLSEELGEFNLILREYFPHSIRENKTITFKRFEHTLLISLDIHRKLPGTSILEKFLSELLTNKQNLKLTFSQKETVRMKQTRKFFALLFLLKRESEKILSHILSLVELVYLKYHKKDPDLKEYLQSIIISEISSAALRNSAFEIVWLVFFWRYIGLGKIDFEKIINNKEVSDNLFVRSMIDSKNQLFQDSKIDLFKTPSSCKGTSLAKQLSVFNK